MHKRFKFAPTLAILAAAAAMACNRAPGVVAEKEAAAERVDAASRRAAAAPRPPAATVAAAAVPQPTPTPSAAERSDAKAMFAQRCTLCHGLAGHGNGPASASLSPRPRDLSLPSWQDSVSDAHIRKILVGGGPAVGKSLMMPANADLADKPALLQALVEVVRNLRKK